MPSIRSNANRIQVQQLVDLLSHLQPDNELEWQTHGHITVWRGDTAPAHIRTTHEIQGLYNGDKLLQRAIDRSE